MVFDKHSTCVVNVLYRDGRNNKKHNVSLIYKFRKKRLDLNLVVSRSKDVHPLRMFALNFGSLPYAMDAAVKRD